MRTTENMAENEWIRYRIGRLRSLRNSVYDRQTLQAIDELIAEAEERLEMLETQGRPK